MSSLKEIVFSLKRSVKKQQTAVQLIILREICNYLESLSVSDTRQVFLRKLIHFNLPLILNEMICSKAEVVLLTSQALCYLSEVTEFWEYFPLILQTLTRALISMERSDQFRLDQVEFVEAILAIDVLLQRNVAACGSKEEQKRNAAHFNLTSLLKLIENTLRNRRIIFCTKLGTSFLYFHILNMSNHLTEEKRFELFYKCCEVGYLLIDLLQKELKSQMNAIIIVVLLKLLTAFLRFLRCSDYNMNSSYQNHFLEVAFVRSLKQLVHSHIFISVKSKSLVVAFLSTLNTFLASNTSTLFKANVFRYLGYSKTIEKLIDYSRSRTDDSLSYQIRILIVELISKIHLEGGNASYTAFDALQSCSMIFSNDFESSHSLIITGQCLPKQENLEVEHDGTFFNLSLACIKENSSISKEFLIQTLIGCYHIIARIYMEKKSLEFQNFWTGLNLFANAFIYLGTHNQSTQIKCASDMLIEILPQYMQFDDQLPTILDKNVLIWLKSCADDKNLLLKLLPVYLMRNLSERNLRIGKLVTPSSLIYLLISNDANQVKNSFLVLTKKHISFHEIEYLLQYACKHELVAERNLEAIFSVLFNSAKEFNKTQKIILCNNIKTILEKKSENVSFYSKEFYIFLVYISSHFLSLP